MVIKRLEQAYGRQKVGLLWYDPARETALENAQAADEAREFWGQQLSRFSGRAIGLALQSWLDEGTGKVPTLDILIARCKQFEQPTPGTKALPAPHPKRPAGYQLPKLPNLGPQEGIDGLRWLRKVGSLSVARELLVLAVSDHRVAKVLEHHLKTDFANVVSPESKVFLRAWAAANPGWKASEMKPEDRAA